MIEAAVSDPFIDEVWTDWYMSFRDPVCTRVQAHVEALGGTVDEARLARIVTALLWTNERNLYRAHRVPQASKGSSAEVAETLAELWSSSLDHIVIDSLPAKKSRA